MDRVPIPTAIVREVGPRDGLQMAKSDHADRRKTRLDRGDGGGRL